MVLVLTRGAPASGKTTAAKQWVAEDPEWRTRVNRDDIRFQLFGKYVLDRANEETVTLVQRAMVTTLLGAKRSVIIDDTNLRAQTVKEWMKLAQSLGESVEFMDFATPLEECILRNKLRAENGGRFVPEDVIRGFFARYYQRGSLPKVPSITEPLEERRPYTPDYSLPDAWIVDVDGTLAQMTGRGPFEWHRVGEDTPIDGVIALVHDLGIAGNHIVFMSGRDEACRAGTEEWIREHVFMGIDGDIELYMRPRDDMRKDSVVKHELFWSKVAHKYNVRGAVDDRKQVVQMWREIGLTVCQVADGDF